MDKNEGGFRYIMKCCFCKKDAGKWGNNAEPICDGRCCDLCNIHYVVPERLHRLRLNDELRKLGEEK